MGNAILDADLYISLLIEQLKVKNATIARLKNMPISDPIADSNVSKKKDFIIAHILNQKDAEIEKQMAVNEEHSRQIQLLQSTFNTLKTDSEVTESELLHEIEMLTYMADKNEENFVALEKTLEDFCAFVLQNKSLLLKANGFEKLFSELITTQEDAKSSPKSSAVLRSPTHKQQRMPEKSVLHVIEEEWEEDELQDESSEQDQENEDVDNEDEDGQLLERCLHIINNQQLEK